MATPAHQTFKLKNPRKGTETTTLKLNDPVPVSFKLKNPRKGTETINGLKTTVDAIALSN